MVAGTGFAVNQVVRRELEDGWRHRAEDDARRMATWVAAPLTAGSDDLVAAVVEGALHESGDAYLIVERADRSVAARVVKPAYADRIQAVLALQERHPETTSVSADGVYALFVPVRSEGKAGPRTAAAAGAAGPVVGYVVYGQDTGRLGDQLARVQLVILAVLLAGALLVYALLWWLTQRLVMRPLTAMSRVAGRVSECDLAARAEQLSDDELGRLAGSLNLIGENLTTTLSRVRGVSEGVGQVIERIARTGAQVAEGTGTVSARVAETGASMGEMISSLKGIADNVEVLAQSADESSSSILEMAATNNEVAENIQALAASVEETTAAIEQMTYSIKEVAKNVEDLSATAEETSSSMNEMDVSISQVESNANETAKLSEQAMKDAELGTESLGRTLAGIARIKESSKEAAVVIDSLGKKIGTIGNILNVIDEVAEQTNLLALNAAILAAQSGEHGKGFAVVADEIKDLAERTGASTKEISELIRSVQDESANAVSAMDRGVKNVEEGVRLGQEAESALKKIQASSVKSTQMVKAIARATIEQARGSKQVTMAINRIAETVQQIATATSEQARGSEQIMKSAEKMKVITKHVERSSQEQARGSKQITKAIESISEMVNHLNRAQKDQTKGSELVMGAVDQIKQVAEAQTYSVKDLEASIIDLARQADVLRGEVKRFKM
ncbi:methyl-accepting chemotaxis protein [Anaeromyxobacter diazotrophicus]